jgi:hypothetical protein
LGHLEPALWHLQAAKEVGGSSNGSSQQQQKLGGDVMWCYRLFVLLHRAAA